MKNKILLSLFILFVFSLKAQITIDGSSVALTGRVITQYHDTSKIPLFTGGANKTWDFSTLKQEEPDTIKFFNKGWFPEFNSILPNANLILTFASESGSWLFLNKSSTSLKTIGYAEDTGSGPLAIEEYNEIIVNFPLTYNSIYQDSFVELNYTNYLGVDPDGPGPAPKLDSLRYKVKFIYTRTGKGWGKVKLAGNVMVDAIMLEDKETTKDIYEIFVNGNWVTVSPAYYSFLGISPDVNNYFNVSWWSNDADYGFPLMSYNYGENDTKAYGADHIQAKVQVSSVNDVAKSYITVYPNPSNDVIYFNNVQSNNPQVNVYDAKGTSVLNSKDIKNGLNLSTLSSGVYVIYLMDNDVLHQFKITKQ